MKQILLQIGTFITVCTLAASPTFAQTTLTNGVAKTNISGSQGSEKHYVISIPSGQVSATFAISGGSGDCDLHVNLGSQATVNNWDFRPYLDGNEETVNVPNTQPGQWFVMLRGYTSYSNVTLLVQYAGSTPVPPSGTVTLQNNVPVQNLSGTDGSMKYFVSPRPHSTRLAAGAIRTSMSAMVLRRRSAHGIFGRMIRATMSP